MVRVCVRAGRGDVIPHWDTVQRMVKWLCSISWTHRQTHTLSISCAYMCDDFTCKYDEYKTFPSSHYLHSSYLFSCHLLLSSTLLVSEPLEQRSSIAVKERACSLYDDVVYITHTPWHWTEWLGTVSECTSFWWLVSMWAQLHWALLEYTFCTLDAIYFIRFIVIVTPTICVLVFTVYHLSNATSICFNGSGRIMRFPNDKYLPNPKRWHQLIDLLTRSLLLQQEQPVLGVKHLGATYNTAQATSTENTPQPSNAGSKPATQMKYTRGNTCHVSPVGQK